MVTFFSGIGFHGGEEQIFRLYSYLIQEFIASCVQPEVSGLTPDLTRKDQHKR